MGLTNSQTIKNKGNSLRIITNNFYKYHKQSGNNSKLSKRVNIMNMNAKQYQQWVTSLKRLEKYNEYLQLPQKFTWKIDCLCTDYGNLEIQYQDCIYTLNDEIGYRWSQKQYFKENQIWYILFLIITIQFNLNNQIKHYSYWNIHPTSIIITQEGYIKLLFTLTHPKKQQNNSHQYIPPQQIPILLIQLIKNNDQRVMMRINKQISQTFQLGLTLLSAVNLINYDYLYKHIPILKLNIEELNSEIQKCAENSRYTIVLTTLIANLCSFNPAHRLSGPELWQWVQDHSQEIKQRNSFDFKYIPKKLSVMIDRKIRDSQQNLLKTSQLKMQQLSKSQVQMRKNDKSLEKSIKYEKNLYQPIHQVSNKYPLIPRYRSSKN